MANISYSLNCTRTRLDKKFITLAADIQHLIYKIKAFISQSHSFLANHDVHITRLVPLTTIMDRLTKADTDRVAMSDADNNTIVESLFYYLKKDSNLDLSALYTAHNYRVPLPPYAFHSQPFWIKTTHHSSHIAQPIPISMNNDTTKQKKLIINKIKERLAGLLNYNLSDISDDRNLADYGIDSIIALQLLEPFKSEVGAISPTILLQSKNMHMIADHLMVLMQRRDSQQEHSKGFINVDYDHILFQELPGTQQIHNGMEWFIFGNRTHKPIILFSPLNTLFHM